MVRIEGNIKDTLSVKVVYLTSRGLSSAQTVDINRNRDIRGIVDTLNTDGVYKVYLYIDAVYQNHLEILNVSPL